jgi:hypothetical protein
MGNIQFDPIVSGVSKRVGNFVYSNWKGINVMRRYNPKRPSATESQIKVREAFRIVVAVWKALPEIMQKSWDASVVGKPMSAYNLFVSKNALTQKNGGIGQLTCVSGIKKLSGYAVEQGSAGTLSVKFDQQTQGVNLTAVIQKIDGGVGTTDLEIRSDLNVSAQPVVIDKLESGKDYFVYLMNTDKPFTEATQISESTGFRVTVA